MVVRVELLRQRCAHCHNAIAALECKSCDRAFCAACESHVHAELHQEQVDEPIKRERSKEREEEEGKGEQRAHQAHVTAINCTLLVVLVVCYDGDLVVADTFLRVCISCCVER